MNGLTTYITDKLDPILSQVLMQRTILSQDNSGEYTQQIMEANNLTFDQNENSQLNVIVCFLSDSSAH